MVKMKFRKTVLVLYLIISYNDETAQVSRIGIGICTMIERKMKHVLSIPLTD